MRRRVTSHIPMCDEVKPKFPIENTTSGVREISIKEGYELISFFMNFASISCVMMYDNTKDIINSTGLVSKSISRPSPIPKHVPNTTIDVEILMI